MVPFTSSNTIEVISAGPIEFINNWAGSSSHITISSLSLPSSLETACTLEPRIPTQAPTGSILLSFVLTAIFVLDPASLAIAFISITCSDISGTSNLNNSPTISGHLLLNAN